MLTNHLEDDQIEGVYSSYSSYIEQNGHIKLSCAEVYQMPGRIRQIVAAALEGKGIDFINNINVLNVFFSIGCSEM